MKYKVVIPSAGIGARVGPYSKFMNKALISVGDKPAISRVIEKFNKKIPIIILIGFKGDMVKEVVSQLYPERKISFIEVNKYQGEGSGLGYSLLKAKKILQCPFIFIPNDTVIGSDKIDLNPNVHGNWAAYYKKTKKDNYNSEIFRTIELDEDRSKVTSITGKGTLNKNIYVGISGIKDYKSFWKFMDEKEATIVGEAYGLNRLKNIKAVKILQWFDCGSLSSLQIAKEYFLNKEFNILEKEDEAIWFIEDKVVKFSVEKSFISDRVKRTQYIPKEFLPKIIESKSYSYKYKKVPGEVISNNFNPSLVSKLLDSCEKNLWSKKQKITKKTVKICCEFYKDKTYERLDKYLKRFEQVDRGIEINGKHALSVKELLDNLNWKSICEDPVWANFHGDFHNENIIYSKKDNFTLLDWRQNFGTKNYEFGDVYYDLSKLNHGFLVSHELVAEGKYSVNEITSEKVSINICQKPNLIECQKTFFDWCKLNGYDEDKINIITALIFVNISGLHESPYSRYLFLLGQSMLSKFS